MNRHVQIIMQQQDIIGVGATQGKKYWESELLCFICEGYEGYKYDKIPVVPLSHLYVSCYVILWS